MLNSMHSPTIPPERIEKALACTEKRWWPQFCCSAMNPNLIITSMSSSTKLHDHVRQSSQLKWSSSPRISQSKSRRRGFNIPYSKPKRNRLQSPPRNASAVRKWSTMCHSPCTVPIDKQHIVPHNARILHKESRSTCAHYHYYSVVPSSVFGNLCIMNTRLWPDVPATYLASDVLCYYRTKIAAYCSGIRFRLRTWWV